MSQLEKKMAEKPAFTGGKVEASAREQ